MNEKIENLKLISVRLNPDTIVKLNRFVARHSYWNRNMVINALLTTLVTDFSERQLYDMARRWNFPRNPARVHYEIAEFEPMPDITAVSNTNHEGMVPSEMDTHVIFVDD